MDGELGRHDWECDAPLRITRCRFSFRPSRLYERVLMIIANPTVQNMNAEYIDQIACDTMGCTCLLGDMEGLALTLDHSAAANIAVQRLK